MKLTDEENHQRLLDMQYLMQEAIKLQEEHEPKEDVDLRLLEINKRGLENINRLLAEAEERLRG
ncbi:hypothetical protein HMPREF3170_03665 [Corynebacterium sp. HMSC08D02]|uniref:hypothetical protein n=1 Tax=Corynebacterium sp. HMSC08D02 TaxID=1581138 RepID=UPI0008A2FCE2|nr:hypothetical protein [Corynebacterium sp. HMSC08D02]OFT30619.1 hypothetical protein HMPREF3170_03665 [Corynebacterium sp. HMSC08D02]